MRLYHPSAVFRGLSRFGDVLTWGAKAKRNHHNYYNDLPIDRNTPSGQRLEALGFVTRERVCVVFDSLRSLTDTCHSDSREGVGAGGVGATGSSQLGSVPP